MATIYVRSSDGDDQNDGSTWALAKASLESGINASGPSGLVYVSQSHYEIKQSTINIKAPNYQSGFVRIYCVDDSSEPPTNLADTAIVVSSGNNAMYFDGYGYINGVIFSGTRDVLIGGTIPVGWILENGRICITNTSSPYKLILGISSTGSDDEFVEFRNFGVGFGNVLQGIQPRCRFNWLNTDSGIIGTMPTTLFLTPDGGNSANVKLDGVNLSMLGSGKNIIDVGRRNYHEYELLNCKLGEANITTGTIPGAGGPTVKMSNCDSTNSNNRYFFQNCFGVIYSETTIVKTSGASDGSNSFSRKMVTNNNSDFEFPLILEHLMVWNNTTGSSKTATVEILTDGVTLTDDECWLEIEYLGDSNFPISSFASDRKTTFLSSPASQTVSTVEWITTGLSSPVKQKLSVSFTPQMKGLIIGRVMLAKKSTTVYVNPVMDIS